MSPELILLAIAIPVSLCALVVIFNLAQMSWEIRKERNLWMKRNAEWREEP